MSFYPVSHLYEVFHWRRRLSSVVKGFFHSRKAWQKEMIGSNLMQVIWDAKHNSWIKSNASRVQSQQWKFSTSTFPLQFTVSPALNSTPRSQGTSKLGGGGWKCAVDRSNQRGDKTSTSNTSIFVYRSVSPNVESISEHLKPQDLNVLINQHICSLGIICF